jgi:hypothetical protein
MKWPRQGFVERSPPRRSRRLRILGKIATPAARERWWCDFAISFWQMVTMASALSSRVLVGSEGSACVRLVLDRALVSRGIVFVGSFERGVRGPYSTSGDRLLERLMYSEMGGGCSSGSREGIDQESCSSGRAGRVLGVLEAGGWRGFGVIRDRASEYFSSGKGPGDGARIFSRGKRMRNSGTKMAGLSDDFYSRWLMLSRRLAVRESWMAQSAVLFLSADPFSGVEGRSRPRHFLSSRRRAWTRYFPLPRIFHFLAWGSRGILSTAAPISIISWKLRGVLSVVLRVHFQPSCLGILLSSQNWGLGMPRCPLGIAHVTWATWHAVGPGAGIEYFCHEYHQDRRYF